MEKLSCSPKILVLVGLLVVVIAMTKEIFATLPFLKNLFTDPLNFVILVIINIFIALLDIPSGIIVALIIIYMSINLKMMNGSEKFDAIPNMPRPSSPNSESEFIYNNTQPFPNVNLKPLQPNPDLAPATPADVKPAPCGDSDFITKVGPPNRAGYDVAGCRYDFKDSPQNLTTYGPPLSQCGTYSEDQYSCTGTLFYPLNA
jgi:hypothetical protein